MLSEMHWHPDRERVSGTSGGPEGHLQLPGLKYHRHVPSPPSPLHCTTTATHHIATAISTSALLSLLFATTSCSSFSLSATPFQFSVGEPWSVCPQFHKDGSTLLVFTEACEFLIWRLTKSLFLPELFFTFRYTSVGCCLWALVVMVMPDVLVACLLFVGVCWSVDARTLCVSCVVILIPQCSVREAAPFH